MDEELVEKVARAMVRYDEATSGRVPTSPPWGWDNLFPHAKDYWRGRARAAIQAMIDAGWKGPEEKA